MSTSEIYVEEHVFDGGPPLRLQKSLGLVKPDEPRVIRRALFGAAIAWAPLAILSIVESIVVADSAANWFFRDFAVHARYLIAVPALVLAERDCIPQLEKIVRQFIETGLIKDDDRPAYQQAVTSTRRLLNSSYGDVVAIIAAYVAVIGFTSYVPTALIADWQRGHFAYFSLAGWWHVCISLPLLLIIFFGWLWRLVLWARFLFMTAKLDLQLLPSHPDKVGGLRFVNTSLRGFRLISFGLGAIAAGAVADRVVYDGETLASFKGLVIALMIMLLVLFAGPLTVFLWRIRHAKWRGIFEYGVLANRLGREFEAKWLSAGTQVKQEVLEQPDFSATTDYFGIASNVYDMKDLPFTLTDLIGPLVPALAPFVVVALFTIPIQVVIDSTIKLLL